MEREENEERGNVWSAERERELEKVRNRERKENAGYRSATQEQRKGTAGLEILYRGFISLTET